MSDHDEDDFMKFMKIDRDVGILPYIHKENKLIILDKLPEKDEPFFFSVCLWDMTNSHPPVLKFISEKKYFTIDRFSSEVISFSRSYFDGRKLVKGRIWADITEGKGEDNFNYLKKTDSFKKWFDISARWIKKNSLKNSAGDYLLSGAQKLQNSMILYK